ncbi:LacI family DNA-binding transcriptional regulator [Massilia sp. Root335]|jgi:LacI family gluconate utilization system Gnt-I transcriptional repressor|uniref:LacI family DNA-binding transcriptional regulator n=1 Tax=Massilia sp. Root335 TaxID=1736517 RepID=UPI0006F3FD18|nr:LacI family DNA-binding transcriptional regulator [Massilia sp. Root335]KQV49586.1 GntR family transcriptional regulator [Massilia sp. Root335]
MNMPAEPPKKTRRTKGGLTLVDVARVAGVAPITVSRVLNSPEKVSADLVQKVRSAIERTGYVPNLLAGSLASTKSRMIAAILPTIAGSVFLDMIQSLTETLAGAGYQLILGQAGYVNSREDELLEAIIGRRPDGIVLAGIMRSAQGRRRLQASAIPLVETWDLTPTPADMLVGFSHEDAGQAVAEFLYQRGRRRVAVISASDERAQRRNNAFAQAAVRLDMQGPDGQVPFHSIPAPGTAANGRVALRALLAAHPDIDAVFCSSDMVALGVLTEARVLDIDVPGRLAVVGLGDHPFAAELYPALTTVRIDGRAMGGIAANFLIDRIAGKDIPEVVRDIGFTIVERDST